MTDILTHALAFVAGALPVWLVMRRKVASLTSEIEWLGSELTLHIQVIRDLRSRLPKPQPRNTAGRFVKRT